MAVALDRAYVLAEEAIESTVVDSFKEILAEFPNLDIYNENTTGADGTSVGWRQPLLGIAIDQENTAIVDTILALEAYNIKNPLYYEDIVGFGPKITAIQYAQDKRRELLQESSPETAFIDYIIEELNKKLHNQTGGKRVNRRKSRKSKSKSKSKSRRATSRRRRH
jgi:hypothetical protein